MIDIWVWLEKTGLTRYADLFADNHIGLDVVDYLTEDHLKELGICIGDRLRLLQAIKAKSCEATEIAPVIALTPTNAPPLLAEAPAPPALSSDAERRPLTVMFCDLADSTALSTRLDPEDLQDVIRSYQETSTKLIQGYRGFVAKYMGERAVIGEAPNIAAGLQNRARRNGIVIGVLTKELAGDSAINADDHESDGASELPELIGRDEETGLLRRAWQSTQDERHGQVVTISGEAGIGKSVLIDALKAEARAEGLPRMILRCSPYHAGSALYPVIEHLKRLAGWQPGDAAETRLGKFEAMLQSYDQPLAETAPLLVSLLSLPLPQDRYRN